MRMSENQIESERKKENTDKRTKSESEVNDKTENRGKNGRNEEREFEGSKAVSRTHHHRFPCSHIQPLTVMIVKI